MGRIWADSERRRAVAAIVVALLVLLAVPMSAQLRASASGDEEGWNGPDTVPFGEEADAPKVVAGKDGPIAVALVPAGFGVEEPPPTSSTVGYVTTTTTALEASSTTSTTQAVVSSTTSTTDTPVVSSTTSTTDVAGGLVHDVHVDLDLEFDDGGHRGVVHDLDGGHLRSVIDHVDGGRTGCLLHHLDHGRRLDDDLDLRGASRRACRRGG